LSCGNSFTSKPQAVVILKLRNMKTIKLIGIGILLLFSGLVKGQVSVSVNIGSPPMWGPIGYAEAHYYYLPDVEAYYDIDAEMFIYFENDIWVHRVYLPVIYQNYDLYSGYKVVLTDYHGNEPYIHYDQHRSKYHKGYHGKAQKTIGANPGKGNKSNGNSGPAQKSHSEKGSNKVSDNGSNNGGNIKAVKQTNDGGHSKTTKQSSGGGNQGNAPKSQSHGKSGGKKK